MAENNAYVFGIDLGTTYSCISYLKDGRAEVCPSLEGENTTPSVVRMMPEEGEPIAGKTAKDMAILYPEYTFQFVKSKIGKVAEIPYGQDNSLVTTPEAVSAEVLKKLATDASAYSNTEVKDVVITVPAYFGNNEKMATKKAGEIAGLNVIDIVEEPTASAFYYGCEKSDENEVICVFDLGGGTFDVTALKIENGNLTVLTTDGNHDLGGKNWDAEMIELVSEKFRDETGYDEEFDADIMQELQIKCEEAKKQLTQMPSTSIVLNVDRNHKAKITVSREEFDDRTEILLSTAIDLTHEVFNRVDERGFTISKILLVGGSSKMPQVKERIVSEFGMEPEINEPDTSVSKGACIYCAWKLLNIPEQEASQSDSSSTDEGNIIKEENDDGTTTITLDGGSEKQRIITLPSAIGEKTIVTVATKSFGIRALVNDIPRIVNLIKKDTKLPFESTNTFGLHDANMTNIDINLFQSEFYDSDYEIEYGDQIASCVIEGLPEGLPEGEPVDITIKLAENGMIEVFGTHRGNDLIGKLEVTYSEGVGEN